MPIKIALADGHFLSRKGMECLLGECKEFSLVSVIEERSSLIEKLAKSKAQLLVIDYTSEHFDMTDVNVVKQHFPKLFILAITEPQNKKIFAQSFSMGVNSHLLKECDAPEIKEAIIKTIEGEKFLCGKVLSVLNSDGSVSVSEALANVSCEGLSVSERELEIIKLVAEGYSNKQVADMLCLSTHTVTTHRKNIMAKLNVNNTAGLVLFAVKHNLISPNKYLFSAVN